MKKINNFFGRLPSNILHTINKVIGWHIFTFGMLAVTGRVLVAYDITHISWFYTWNIKEDVGMSAVTGVFFILISFMLYLYDIQINRRDEKET